MKDFIHDVLTQQMADAEADRRNLGETQDWVTAARLEVESIRRDNKDLKVAVKNLRNEVMEVMEVHRDRIDGIR